MISTTRLPLVVAEADVKSPTEGVSALDTLVDLAVTQPRSNVDQAVAPPPGLLAPTMGLAPATLQCPTRPMPPCPWLLTTISHPSDRRGIRILIPLCPVSTPAEQLQGQAMVTPPDQVDAAMRTSEVPIGTNQGAVAGAGLPAPAGAATDLPAWAERVEEQEAEARIMSSVMDKAVGCYACGNMFCWL